MVLLYSWILVWVDAYHYNIADRSVPVIHSLLGFVISIILVFRTNTAYERWWEARKQWGQLLNTSRTLSMKLNAYLPMSERTVRREFQVLLSGFASVLKNHLRREKLDFNVEMEENDFVFLESVDLAPHQPNRVAGFLVSRVIGLKRMGYLSEEELLTLNSDLNSLVDILGACERIKNTPPPRSYVLFMRKIILLYVVSLPLSLLGEFGFGTVLIAPLVFYMLAALEAFAVEIEDPFGYEANDLPLDTLAESVRVNVSDLISLEVVPLNDEDAQSVQSMG